MCMCASFLPLHSSRPFCRFSIFVFFLSSFTFSTFFTKMKAYTVRARAQASIFTVFWPFSKKNVKLLKKSER